MSSCRAGVDAGKRPGETSRAGQVHGVLRQHSDADAAADITD